MKRLTWDADLLDAFGPSVEANPWGWGTAREVLTGSHAFELRHGGRHVLFAVRPVVRSEGTRLDVTACVSLGDRAHAADVDAALKHMAGEFGARALAMSTLRPHVAQVARRLGWTEAGVLMTKRLDLQ